MVVVGALGASAVLVAREEEEQVVIPGASMSTSLVHRSHLCLQPLRALLFVSSCPQQLPLQPSLTAVLPVEELTGGMAQRGIKGAA